MKGQVQKGLELVSKCFSVFQKGNLMSFATYYMHPVGIVYVLNSMVPF